MAKLLIDFKDIFTIVVAIKALYIRAAEIKICLI